jgi:hypothetical protein
MSKKSSMTLKQKRAAKRAKPEHATPNVDALKEKQRRDANPFRRQESVGHGPAFRDAHSAAAR